MMLDYVASCFEDFIEIHGDRHIGDDGAMPGGFARIEGIKCMVIGHEKGRETDEKLKEILDVLDQRAIEKHCA